MVLAHNNLFYLCQAFSPIQPSILVISKLINYHFISSKPNGLVSLFKKIYNYVSGAYLNIKIARSLCPHHSLCQNSLPVNFGNNKLVNSPSEIPIENNGSLAPTSYFPTLGPALILTPTSTVFNTNN